MCLLFLFKFGHAVCMCILILFFTSSVLHVSFILHHLSASWISECNWFMFYQAQPSYFSLWRWLKAVRRRYHSVFFRHKRNPCSALICIQSVFTSIFFNYKCQRLMQQPSVVLMIWKQWMSTPTQSRIHHCIPKICTSEIEAFFSTVVSLPLSLVYVGFLHGTPTRKG